MSAFTLVTGFEPFDGRRCNRSWEVVRRLQGRPGLEIVQLPVEYEKLKERIPALAARGAQGLLLVGESSARTVAVEQIALNVVNCERPDNSGRNPETETIVPGAPLALRAGWDARGLARRIRAAGVPAKASFHAGTFACNAAFFLALHACGDRVRAGFLHVPRRPWPVGIPTAGLLRAIELCLESLAG